MNKSKPTKIEFVQNSLPALEAGEYRLHIDQNVKIKGAEKQPNLKGTELPFAVWGERYNLVPDEVIKVYPPAHTTGEYGNVLPHLMLRRKTLPWERSIYTKGDPAEKEQGNNVAPWLALLVFDQNDPPFQRPGITRGASRTGTLADLLPSSKDTISYFSEAKKNNPNVKLEALLDYGESENEKCQLIDISVTLFNKIAPTQEDLCWLAHNQISYFKNGTIDTEVAVVVGNRLPKQGSMSTAHLVSLEGMEMYLPTKDGPAKELENKTAIRLVSLYSWTFNAVKVPIHFSIYLENLNHANKEGMEHSILRRPVMASSNASLNQYFKQGLLPFNHFTRTGDPLVSWYRGPLVPEEPASKLTFSKDDPFYLPAASADGVTFFDAKTGMYQLQYAAAWQLGRLYALNSKPFATNVFEWRKRLVATTIEKAQDARILPSRTSRKEFYSKLLALMKDPTAISKLHDQIVPNLPATILNWLVQLHLLKNLPFHYLVPDGKMLPKESMKFFKLDRNWLACAFDGAMSIGRNTDAQWAHDEAFLAGYFKQVREKAGFISNTNVNTTGLLLRSAVVKGWWPGIQVDGYSSSKITPDPSSKIPRIRLETLSDEILICLFDDGEAPVKRVNIHEPAQGTHFGVSATSPAGTIQKELRFVSGTFTQPDHTKPTAGAEMFSGSESTDEKPIMTSPLKVSFDNRSAIPIAEFAKQLELALRKNNGLAPKAPFTSAEFGLEMIEGVEEVGYRLGNQ